MALTSQSLQAPIGPLQFSLRHWNLRNLTLHSGITRDFVRLHSTFARLYNAAASPASRLRSAGSLANTVNKTPLLEEPDLNNRSISQSIILLVNQSINQSIN